VGSIGVLRSACPRLVKLYVQVCPHYGADLYLPDPRAVRHPSVGG
jgi:hypothetical protein